MGASFGRRVAGEARSFVSRRVGATPKERGTNRTLFYPIFPIPEGGRSQPSRDVLDATLGFAARTSRQGETSNGKRERNGWKTD
ncbi:MAG: hypothetical protein IJO06_10185 [Thermoguttaceae bacterium]|nr:hypothetical protein [Thermoguttaceae bacterium]